MLLGAGTRIEESAAGTPSCLAANSGSGPVRPVSPPSPDAFYRGVQRKALIVQKQHVEKIHVPRHILIDYLASGFGYDKPSIERAIQKGNEHFKARELKHALDFFGIAYELARMHCVYLPLMHDILLRRVLCLSMLGDLKAALLEADFALQAVPNSVSVNLVRAMIFAKIDACDDATVLFQDVVSKCHELRDFVDCMVALFAAAKGHVQSGIDICSGVLQRTRDDAFALVVRCDAYKFHPSGMYSREASADSARVLEKDKSLQPFIGSNPADAIAAGHGRVDELLLRFHPWIQAAPPRPFAEYPMYVRRNFLSVSALVLYAIARLRTLVRSSRLVRSVWRQHEALLQQRAAAEQRMAVLLETQRKVAAMDSHTEVWGPADPDSWRVQKYRRYWMERPLDFPLRKGTEAIIPARSFSQPTTPLPTPADHPQPKAPLSPPPAREENAYEVAERNALRAHVSSMVKPKGVADSHAGHLATLGGSTFTPAPAAPPPKIGSQWDEKQWVSKALELIDGFKDGGANAKVDYDCVPTFQVPQPAEPRLTVTPLTHQAPTTGGRRTAYTNLVETIFEHGFQALPVWYDALDQVFEVTQMTPCRARPEPPFVNTALAGTPGRSYIVPPKATRSHHQASLNLLASYQSAQSLERELGTAGEDTYDGDLNAATVQRYQNRLLGVSLGIGMGS